MISNSAKYFNFVVDNQLTVVPARPMFNDGWLCGRPKTESSCGTYFQIWGRGLSKVEAITQAYDNYIIRDKREPE